MFVCACIVKSSMVTSKGFSSSYLVFDDGTPTGADLGVNINSDDHSPADHANSLKEVWVQGHHR